MAVINHPKFFIATTPPISPAIGDMYYDDKNHAMMVWMGNAWHKTYMSDQHYLEKISANQFLCPTTLSISIDGKIIEIGLESVKKSRKFDKSLYTVDDEVELSIFNVYFSDFIK